MKVHRDCTSGRQSDERKERGRKERTFLGSALGAFAQGGAPSRLGMKERRAYVLEARA